MEETNSPLSMLLQLEKGMSDVCLRCWGFGHFARECPTPESKGKEKGAKGGEGGVDVRFQGTGDSFKGGWYAKSGVADNVFGEGNQVKSCGKEGTKGVGCAGKLVARRRSVVEKAVGVGAWRRLRRRWWRMLAGSG